MDVPLTEIVARYRTELNDLTHNWIVHRVLLKQLEDQLEEKDRTIAGLQDKIQYLMQANKGDPDGD
jgi:hypothetical protein